MAVTVAERQGRSREGQAERSCKRRGERRNTNGQRGRVRATSWRVTAKSQGHQDASGRVRRHAPKVHDLTRGDLRRESAGEVSKDRSSVEVVRKHCGAKGRRTERLEEESGEGVVRNEDRRGRGNCGHYPPRLLGGPAVQPLQPPRARSKTPFSASFPNARLEVQPPDAENRTSGGVGGVAGAIPPPRPDRLCRVSDRLLRKRVLALPHLELSKSCQEKKEKSGAQFFETQRSIHKGSRCAPGGGRFQIGCARGFGAMGNPLPPRARAAFRLAIRPRSSHTEVVREPCSGPARRFTKKNMVIGTN